MLAGHVTSSLRPIPLERRGDLEFSSLGDVRETTAGWVVKDPLSLEYHRLEAVQYAVLQRLTGDVSVQELLLAVQETDPAQAWTLPDLQNLVIDLHQKGLVISRRPGQAQTLQRRREKLRWQRWQQIGRSLLFARFPGWNPRWFLEFLLPWIRWVYHPVAITLGCLFVMSAWLLILVEFSEFRRRLPEFQQFFGWSNLPLLWATLALTKLIHEFGHGLTCHYYGRRCHEMGVMLLLFSPTLYCDVTDSWMIRERWPRIWIGAGGMLFEAVLAAAATYLWWWTQPGLVHHLALNVVFVSAVTTVIFNANPLMRYDGYYMLSDWLGIANLRTLADRLLDRRLAEWVCGRQLLPDPLLPRHSELWLAGYSLAATTYGWFLTGSILLFLYSWLKPYQLQSLGITLALLSLGGLLISLSLRLWRVSRSPRHGSLRYGRVAVTLIVLAGCLAALLSVPVPWFVEAAVLIEPAAGVQLLNPVPGTLRSIHYQAGDPVAKGDIILELENPELDDQVEQLTTEITAQEATVATARSRQDQADLTVALERLNGLQQRLQEARNHQQQLLVIAPVAGRLIAAEDCLPHPESDSRLSTWERTPLDRQNIGGWLEPRTPLATIAPNARLTAILFLPQAHRNEVTEDCPVSLQFHALPGQIFHGQLSRIAHEHADVAPRALTNKAGGPLATVTRPDQQEQLQQLAYRGEVLLDDPHHTLRSGLRGSARILVSHHTAAWWIAQTLRRTFRFRL